jgi:transcriptional regulator with XRE-family HTH domain
MGQIRDEILLGRIAEKLKEIRASKGLTLEEVYNDTNIHIARIESTKGNVSVSTLSVICKYFGISLSQFFKSINY